ncbi:MAG: DUF6603 domain-containing protein [Pyrinomonadaceae bacterium]
MASNPGTLEALARQLALALEPLKDELTPPKILQRLAETGLALPPAVLANPGFSTAVNNTANAAGNLSPLIVQLTARIESGDDAGIASIGAQLVQQIGMVFTSLDAIGPALKAVGPLPGVNAAELTSFANVLPSRLLGQRVISFLEHLQPSVVGIGNLLGVIDRVRKPGVEDDPLHPPFVLEQLQLGKLGDVLQSPANVLKSLYGWGEPGFDGSLLMPRLATSLSLLGLHVYVDATGKALKGGLMAVKVIPGTPPGISATLSAPILSGIDVTLPLTTTWSAHARAQGIFAAGLQIDVTPPSTVTMKPSPGGGTLNGELRVDLIARSPDKNRPQVLLGQAGGSRLQTTSITIGVGLSVKSNVAEPEMRFEITGGKVVIDTGKADGFITKLLGASKLESNFDLAGDYSISNGLHFQGSSALEVQLASHFNLGPLAVNALTLSVGIKDGAFPIGITADLETSLGPLVAVVQGIGFKVDVLLTSDNKGNLGPVDLKPGFLAPKGVGLSLDAGGFKGGGFLMLDSEKGEYAGALELDFNGLFTVKAIGIINTKMPDGSKTFSLLIVIAAEFTPIQLSFGFTLNGVGGIFGLNRMIVVDALAEGIRTNAIKSILFPENVIANITRIISDIKQFFPPQNDHFVVGPMAKLGWGTPSIITVELGLLLDLPEPKIIIVGVLKAVLPEESIAILRLQVNFIGVVDFERGYIFFRADLYDSRLLIYSITGSMALLVSWGETQTFALSVGGFHPDFRDIPTIPALPNGFRNMARIGISLLSDDNPRLKVESYFAVTSNTVQFGAKVELYAAAAGFNVYGFLGYDVLFQFEPFRFIAKLYGGIALRTGTEVIAGINISAQLMGPTPWDARGDASLTLLFFEISVGFHVTWGDPPPAISPATEDLLQLLLREYADTRNWRAELPPNNHLHVSLKQIDPPTAGEMLVIHPAGVLTFSQRSLPLEDYLIQKFGSRKPLADNKFKLTNANANGSAIPADYRSTREQFAPGNFTELNDSDKLSRRSFEQLPSGFRLTGTSDLQTTLPVVRDVIYELSYLRQKTLESGGLVSLVTKIYERVVKGSAVRQSVLSLQQTRSSLNAPPRVALPAEGFAVASSVDLKSHVTDANGPVLFASQAEAYQHQHELLAANPALVGTLQVVSHFELNAN